MLMGCSGERLSFGEAAPATPNANMDGRWILAEPNAPTCGMNFTGEPGVRNGAIEPEGGCPERFFMSRYWVFELSTLVLKDHENNALAHLTFADGRFDGQSSAGTPVTLSR